MDIKAFWDAVLRQDADAIREYFHPNAWVNWHNTNEHFTVEEFIRANCEYPGQWDGEVERIITTDTHIITATLIGLIASNEDAQRFYRNLPCSEIKDEGIWIDL